METKSILISSVFSDTEEKEGYVLGLDLNDYALYMIPLKEACNHVPKSYQFLLGQKRELAFLPDGTASLNKVVEAKTKMLYNMVQENLESVKKEKRIAIVEGIRENSNGEEMAFVRFDTDLTGIVPANLFYHKLEERTNKMRDLLHAGDELFVSIFDVLYNEKEKRYRFILSASQYREKNNETLAHEKELYKQKKKEKERLRKQRQFAMQQVQQYAIGDMVAGRLLSPERNPLPFPAVELLPNIYARFSYSEKDVSDDDFDRERVVIGRVLDVEDVEKGKLKILVRFGRFA